MIGSWGGAEEDTRMRKQRSVLVPRGFFRSGGGGGEGQWGR